MDEKRETLKPVDLVGKDWLTPEEVTVAYPLGRTRLYALLNDGSILSSKYGRTRFIRRADIEAFLERHMQVTP
jgi:excisionase family DNA binding protein